jgi:nucleoid DNA-binding protein
VVIVQRFVASEALILTTGRHVPDAIQKSGEKVKVAAKYVPHFKAGKNLRERVDQRN